MFYIRITWINGSPQKNSIGIQTAKLYNNYLQSRIVPRLGNFILSKLSDSTDSLTV